jgi:hypothetical protein
LSARQKIIGYWSFDTDITMTRARESIIDLESTPYYYTIKDNHDQATTIKDNHVLAHTNNSNSLTPQK